MSKKNMESWWASSYLYGGNSTYLDDLYEIYLKDPSRVPAEWCDYFDGLPQVGVVEADVSHARVRRKFRRLVSQPKGGVAAVSAVTLDAGKQIGVYRYIQAYRRFGHLIARLDPLNGKGERVPDLELAPYGLSPEDYGRRFDGYGLAGPAGMATFREIDDALKAIYCNHIGFEYFHVGQTEENHWLQDRIESAKGKLALPGDEKVALLNRLIMADGLEKHFGTKFVGQKRFSLEGGSSFIPALHEIVQQSGAHGVTEVVLTLAHRGRLNAMVNVLGQTFEEARRLFEGEQNACGCYGDVRYHLGYSSDVETKKGPVHVSMCFNPSHLESINVVAMGSVRARQDRRSDRPRREILPVVVHGDAAFAGEGIVMEGLNMSGTRAYDVGGVLHIVVNNQIGFTTDSCDSRSSHYCTEIAKIIDAPVFHVNGDDPEAVLFVSRLALDYRVRFGKDVVIDLVCYRRLGHNEADEPSATQPCLYSKVRQHPETWQLYHRRLIQEGICSKGDAEQMLADYRAILNKGGSVVDTLKKGLTQNNAARWVPFKKIDWHRKADTRVKKSVLRKLGKQLNYLPDGFALQKQVGNTLKARALMAAGELSVDWGYGETMAYATLLADGFPVRLCGQDSQRGTFAHRHAVLHDQNDGSSFTPLAQINPKKAHFEIDNSVLCEAGALGFEFGYASTEPNSLVIWEAQFGDFANNAQTIIDQYITPARHKWGRYCGLVLLLPHGYEGMGSEHSSARLERYLQLSAEDCMQVCVPTTPAQIFHLLRRQMLQHFRVPLIVMSPKSLLRHKLVVSTLDDLANGGFEIVIPEIDSIPINKTKRVVLCSGKVYYDLLAARRESERDDVALIRLEQLRPFPAAVLRSQLARYKKLSDIVWCQEEPRNQGAWLMIRDDLEACLAVGQSLRYAGRPEMAVTAEGLHRLYQENQTRLINDALKNGK